MRERAMTSTNNFGYWVQRSDGFGRGIFDPGSRLRRCSCGELFLWSEHVVPTLEERLLLLGEHLERGEPLKDFWSPASAPASKPAARWRWPWARRQLSSPAITQTIDPPEAGRLTPSELEDALSGLDGSEAAEFEWELRLWCFWNRNARRVGVELAEPLEPPDDNTARLLELLPSDPDAAVLVRSQALRDLGRFDQAMAACSRLPKEHPWRAQLIELAQSRRRDVTVLT
jgi:hypothetical protein